MLYAVLSSAAGANAPSCCWRTPEQGLVLQEPRGLSFLLHIFHGL